MATKEKWRTKAARMREEARETGKVILRAPALKSRLVLVDGLRGLRPRDCRQALALLNQTQTNERGVRHD